MNAVREPAEPSGPRRRGFVLRYRSVAPPALSIVVPSRDTRALTIRCLASIEAAARVADSEIILVDDGSGDDTAAEVRVRFPGVRVVRHEVPRGFTAAANTGLRLASGAVRLLLNSDTELRPGGLDVLIEAFDADPSLGIAGAQLAYPDGAAQWSGGRAPGLAWLFAEASGLAGALARLPGYRRLRPLDRRADRDVDWVTGAALAMRRDVWEAVGPLDEAFGLYGQDLDFCLRAGDRGWRVRIAAGFRVLHHHGATVARVFGRPGRQHVPAKWTDLRRWAEKRRGPAYARRVAWAIAAGAALRLAGRRVLTPAVPAPRRDRWLGETHELRLALAALRASVPAGRT